MFLIQFLIQFLIHFLIISAAQTENIPITDKNNYVGALTVSQIKNAENPENYAVFFTFRKLAASTPDPPGPDSYGHLSPLSEINQIPRPLNLVGWSNYHNYEEIKKSYKRTVFFQDFKIIETEKKPTENDAEYAKRWGDILEQFSVFCSELSELEIGIYFPSFCENIFKNHHTIFQKDVEFIFIKEPNSSYNIWADLCKEIFPGNPDEWKPLLSSSHKYVKNFSEDSSCFTHKGVDAVVEKITAPNSAPGFLLYADSNLCTFSKGFWGRETFANLVSSSAYKNDVELRHRFELIAALKYNDGNYQIWLDKTCQSSFLTPRIQMELAHIHYRYRSNEAKNNDSYDNALYYWKNLLLSENLFDNGKIVVMIFKKP